LDTINRNRNIILIDDVWTTGATIEEARGELFLKYEAIKKKLDEQGYFDNSNKMY
jgi:predicted amidophosphoribosyltransferase